MKGHIRRIVNSLPMEISLFRRIARKAFQKPMHGRLWRGKVCSGRNLPLCPISIRPAMEEIRLCPQEEKPEARVQSFCFILRPGPQEPACLLQAHGLLDPRACVCSHMRGRTHKRKGCAKITERERESKVLCSPGL